jgi:hypothetical protein
VHRLSEEGIKEVTLLGQNVNSYHDKSKCSSSSNGSSSSSSSSSTGDVGAYVTAEGFTNMYRSRGGAGAYFADLLAAVADVSTSLFICITFLTCVCFNCAVGYIAGLACTRRSLVKLCVSQVNTAVLLSVLAAFLCNSVCSHNLLFNVQH